MVCTGCCSSLDHIVTYLFKQLSRSTKKRPTPMATDDRFLHIMQQHPEMIQQVRGQRVLFLYRKNTSRYSYFVHLFRLFFLHFKHVVRVVTAGLLISNFLKTRLIVNAT